MNLTPAAALAPTRRPEPAGSRGYAYVCRRCDVYGFAAASQLRVCWSCDGHDRLEQR